MSYPHYKPDLSGENNNPFIVSKASPSTPTTPQRYRESTLLSSPIFHFQNTDRPSKRSKVDKELPIYTGAKARMKIQELEAKKIENESKIKKFVTDKTDLELKILENKLRTTTRLEKEMLAKCHELEEENSKLRMESHTEIQQLKNEIHILNQNQLDTKSESRIKENDLINKVRSLEAEKIDLQSQIGYLNDQKLRTYNILSPQLESLDLLKNQLKDQLDHIQKLEEKNKELDSKVKHYKEISPGINILQQKLDETEYQLYQLSTLRKKAAVLEAENTLLKNEKTEWLSYLDQEKDKLNVNSPYSLCKELASRRTEIQMLKARIQNFDEQLKSKDSEISEKEAKIKQIQEKCNLMISEHGKEMESLKQDNLLFRKEVEMLSASLKSYEDEDKLLSSRHSA
ncbi:2251_t:CDS:10 [Entrophospora sp. SA101]|nr:2251_t:CDS:10 [Entrophospora sp. SA101]CAJ0856939.1 17011_t:CDS:10 [Entrophospora sp. SA101]